VVTGEYRLGDVRHVTASPELAAAELGFRAQREFDAGMKESLPPRCVGELFRKKSARAAGR
jgi:hypothetical protein